MDSYCEIECPDLLSVGGNVAWPIWYKVILQEVPQLILIMHPVCHLLFYVC